MFSCARHCCQLHIIPCYCCSHTLRQCHPPWKVRGSGRQRLRGVQAVCSRRSLAAGCREKASRLVFTTQLCRGRHGTMELEAVGSQKAWVGAGRLELQGYQPEPCVTCQQTSLHWPELSAGRRLAPPSLGLQSPGLGVLPRYTGPGPGLSCSLPARAPEAGPTQPHPARVWAR